MSTSEPLLSSLCSNCRMNPPKYKCPGCSRLTCSLACVKQHKRRVPCSGVRDIQKVALKDLFTVTGINNDYNFITGIERGIERAERIIIHEKGLIPKRSDRKPVPMEKRQRIMERDSKLRIFEPDRQMIQKENYHKKVTSAIARAGVVVKQAPVGMQRNKDNQTSLAQQRFVNWQIEWITDDGTRTLDKLSEKTPLGDGYEQGLTQRARATMTITELNASKKRKEKQVHRSKKAKRRKLDASMSKPIKTTSYLQNMKNSHWNVPSNCILPGRTMEESSEQEPLFESSFYFYLLRPFTPSSQPKVLIPLDSSKPLSQLLRDKVVFEFPTIYVSKNKAEDMSKSFIMEEAFLNPGRQNKIKGKAKGKGLVEYSDTESESGSESESDFSPDSDSQKEEEDPSKDEDEDLGATSWSKSSEEDFDEDGDSPMADT